MPNLSEIDQEQLFRIGGASITIGGLIAALVVLVAAWALSWVATRALRRLRERSTRSAGALYVLEKLASYGLILFGVFAALSTAGLNLSSLAVFAGAIGIGVGLGLQGVVKEFVSGLFLIFDRMVSVGDFIELEDGVRGVIAEVGPRATRIRTNDNLNIVVPNSHLIEGSVTNWTLKGDTRRIHIPFGVAYGADRAAVREAVLEAARNSPFTLPETDTRKSQVWLTGFGDSSLNFELLVWPTREAVKRPGAMHAAYTWAIADALDKAGVEIPFPQTDLRLRSVFGREGDDALKTLGLAVNAGAPSEPKPAAPAPRAPPVNDAAEDLMTPEEETANGEEPGPATR
ncbi:mechanosensitive ion channel [Brevundimonas basaltis]|uniref:Small-conductance mechanosensitive channel n=1 Tax=Brevundimonas basaltis TaxID=472166 RepID=A0A7W8MHV4_9CAUL|nr:mechanosensitive ion channel domain-containing protein [Brevundimonas basaltis]MBB5292366.1 small-conductance mechanosensitive channel [Brevundimonas basaltis]